MKCTECKADSLVLATTAGVDVVYTDQAYGDFEPISLGIDVRVGVHVCQGCGHVEKIWIEEPRISLWTKVTNRLPPKDYDDWVLANIDFNSPSCSYPAKRLATYDYQQKRWRTQFTWCPPHWRVIEWMYLPVGASKAELEGKER